MQAVFGQHLRLAAAFAADRGDVDPVRTGPQRLGAADRIEGVDLRGHLRRVARLGDGERSHAPVRDRQHQHPSRLVAGKGDGPLQQRGELYAEFIQRSAAVLVVDADEQAHQHVLARDGRLRLRRVDARVKFVGGPAGGGHDPWLAEVAAFQAQGPGQLYRPAAAGFDAFADAVGIAQRQERRQRRRRRAGHRGIAQVAGHPPCLPAFRPPRGGPWPGSARPCRRPRPGAPAPGRCA